MADVQIRDTNVKITDILQLIGEGFTYEQITQKYPQITIADIMMSAKIAEELSIYLTSARHARRHE